MRMQVFIMALTSLLLLSAMLMRAKYGSTTVNEGNNAQQERVDTVINKLEFNDI